MSEVNSSPIISPELQVLLNNQESGYNYRERRQQDWLENYTLYRDKVTVNRLTQRQSVNIPLMKQTIRTLLKDVDDMPVLFFENLDNDKQKEVFLNEYWKWTVDVNRMDLQDIVDKRQVFLFGRTFDQWQIVDGQVKQTIQDPQDMLVSRFTNPWELNSSRFLIHQHIFTPLSVIEQNEDYDKAEVAQMKKYYATEMGLVKAADNQDALVDKQEKLQEMGVEDVDSPVLGETWVELTMHFVFEKREGSDEEEIVLKVVADNMRILMDKPLDEVIGKTEDDYWKTHYPYTSWGDDLEKQDFWSDGVADIVRTPNKVLNSMFSQLVENRTLRNFGMQYYDSTTAEEFMPETYNPQAWGWYALPGKPADIVQRVEIPDLSESMDEMNYVNNIAEKASGATATQQGAQTARKVTLGEVELALTEAKDRVKGMSKFYTPAWKRRGEIFLKLVEAAGDKLDAVTIYKKGRNTDKVYSREVESNDWRSKSGYNTMVWSQDEKDAQDTEKLQKLNATKAFMPDNPKLDEVYKRKLLEFADLPPDDITDIMEFEQQKREAILQQVQSQGQLGPEAGGQLAAPQMQPQPVQQLAA